MNSRQIVFFALDRLKGSTIKKALEELSGHDATESDNDEALSDILHFAKTEVPYYRNLIKKGMRLEKLSDFPVLCKDQFKMDYAAFSSDVFRGRPLHEMSTSGSTGTPFTVRMDPLKRAKVIAELIYYNQLSGQELGERYIYLKTWKKKKSSIEQFMQNVVPIDIMRLNESTLRKIRDTIIRDATVKSMLAYASTYEVLYAYLKNDEDFANRYQHNLRAIYTSSTLMPMEIKTGLQNIFHCPVIDRYSNQENGLLAQTRPNEDIFYLNRNHYYFELLALDSDTPVQKGEVGRVVVTDLYNKAMPMIRYDTGDLAVSDDEHRHNLRTFRSLMGRKLDLIYDVHGNALTPHVWSVHLRKYQRVRQWQFIQEGAKEYRLKINGGESYPEEDYISTLKSILGNEAKIEIEFVDSIPVMASGKFKNTINLFKTT